ncbi:MAG: 16S rRNA (uracil(1498)-N(3))-methyltransferase [Thermoanaerobaculia bacterium]|nr:16S rRNA (uracil(1498)-N(3))-methyltransferase [Thermoanaerobaculia bacterium]
MNLLLLEPADIVSPSTAVVSGRRAAHVSAVLRSKAGDTLTVGLLGGKIGVGIVGAIDDRRLSLELALDRDPPPPLPVVLVLALPRPKVLNRVIASVTSLGVKRIVLVNAWRVEKSYWKSPRLDPTNLREQAIAGLEQARDTVLPTIELQRLFRPFVEAELPSLSEGTLRLVAHPGAQAPLPENVDGPVTLVIGPEGGWIVPEIESLERAGFVPVSLGPRILRVETAVAAVLSRLF